ncbi:2-hydroxyacid dehydrogenase [Nocardioides mesophilus]|uniref:2-hydroxyacid dehydrogenase n=1 Tax=Nocardioides mesophilus TaxID=433659 RepID=A0A7G9R8X5_9ACTN|nr:2-hydroxyacid dehydrogenase [Nocardioides mesophilus]QNN52050.1 2-hydroxyacid dehydrogenase [Nocardioides mesophilus]
MSTPLVWLPFDPSLLGEPPAGLRYEVVVPDELEVLPGSVSEVEFYVPSYGFSEVDVKAMEKMTSLRVVQTQSAGVDHLREHVPDGVLLCNGRGIHDASTAELAMTLMLASLRGIPGFVRAQDAHEWIHGTRPALADRTVLIVGYGAVGAALERRLDGFETQVVRVARSEREGVHAMGDLPDLLPRADVVVLIVPLTDETRGLMDAEALARMKDGALLVNVARGPVVDTDALVAELRSGRLCAALDVTDPEPLPAGHPLWDCPNLLVSPHVGGATSAMEPRAYRLVREQLERYATGQPLVNVMSGDY